MRFKMLYSGEQNLSFKSRLVFYAGDSLNMVSYNVYTIKVQRDPANIMTIELLEKLFLKYATWMSYVS